MLSNFRFLTIIPALGMLIPIAYIQKLITGWLVVTNPVKWDYINTLSPHLLSVPTGMTMA
jgi:hypothetical protein